MALTAYTAFFVPLPPSFCFVSLSLFSLRLCACVCVCGCLSLCLSLSLSLAFVCSHHPESNTFHETQGKNYTFLMFECVGGGGFVHHTLTPMFAAVCTDVPELLCGQRYLRTHTIVSRQDFLSPCSQQSHTKCTLLSKWIKEE